MDRNTVTPQHNTDRNEHLRSIGVTVTLRHEIEYYRDLCIDLQSRWKGILTPSGKDKELPWFVVTFCRSCEKVKFTCSKRSVGVRWLCDERKIEDGKSFQCGHLLRAIIPIGMTKQEMRNVRNEWKMKYGME